MFADFEDFDQIRENYAKYYGTAESRKLIYAKYLKITQREN